MKRLMRNSCLGLLLILLFGGIAALSVFAVIFQQSQATWSNAVVVVTARVTPTPWVVPLTAVPLWLPSTAYAASADGVVTIQIDATLTAIPTDESTVPVMASSTPFTPQPLTATSGLPMTASDVPRYSGTSSYPLTVTAEVMLAQTHVANYQANVAATRTAIAGESVGIFATLTAAAPTATVGAP